MYNPFSYSSYLETQYFVGYSIEGNCGSGMVVSLNENHVFNIWMGGGWGRNTKVKLISMWGVLFFAKSCGIDSIKIMGDSKMGYKIFKYSN